MSLELDAKDIEHATGARASNAYPPAPDTRGIGGNEGDPEIETKRSNDGIVLPLLFTAIVMAIASTAATRKKLGRYEGGDEHNGAANDDVPQGGD